MPLITVEVHNSMSHIAGLTVTQFKQLRDVLSYSISAQSAYFSSAHSTKRYLLSKRGEFPSGLLPLVKDYLSKQTAISTYNDHRKRPEARHGLFSLNLGFDPYPEQGEAAEAARTRGMGTICAPTGYGKSVLIAILVHKLQLRTLIVVPNLGLKQQLTADFKKWFGDLNNITIENIDSPALLQATDYDVLIIDEAHHAAAKTYRDLNRKAWTKVFHRYFFTATPFRSREEEQILLESVAGQVVYKITYEEAVKLGRIVPLEAYYIEIEPMEMKGNEYSWPAVYSELVVHHNRRNKLIADLLSNLDAAGISTLCLVREVAHGKNLNDLTGIHFVKGENEDNRIKLLEFNLRELNSLIGTTGVMGEGQDTKPCEYVIIAGLGKSRPAFMQQCGRSFRRYPGKETAKVVLIKDTSHKFTLAHFKAQCKTLAIEYGVKPVKLEMI